MRTIWFVAGSAAGVYASARARRVAEAFSVDGLHDRFTGWFAGARVVREELRAASRERETELRARLRAVPDGRALESGAHEAPLRAPATDHDDLAGLTGPAGNGRDE